MAFHFKQGDRPLPGYTIQRGIGTGGFGEVYYATSDGGKEVALKYLRDNPQVELRGATHCLNLKSPYLVALHDIKQNPGGEFFVIMEYVNGPTLRDLMNAEPAGLGPQKAAYFLREIGKGLAYLHDRGIVHRDLKPGNIFYEDGYVKIGDYGLAKIMASSQHSGQTVSVGTVHYMAPEVGSGNYDRTIDVYALGVLLYEMLLGRVPFSGASMGEVLMKHLTAQPEVEELPEPFPHVIRKALAKDPKDRYQTVTEMVSELFEIEDLSRSVAAFEPASLSTIAARVARNAHVTLTAAGVAQGGKAAGPLGTGSSNVGQAVPPPIIDPSAADRTGDDAIGPAAGRIRKRACRMAARLDESVLGREVAALARRPRNSAESVVLSVMICAAMSAAVMALKREYPDYAVAVFIHCAAVVGGILFAYRHILRAMQKTPKRATYSRRRHQLRWSHRAMSIGFVAMALGLMNTIARKNGWAGGDSRHWLGAIVLAVIFCDWYGRIRAGQQGRVSLGSALIAGLIGFVAGNLVAGAEWLPVVGIMAAASLSIQILAGAKWMQKEVDALPATAGSGGAPVPSSKAGDPPWRRMWKTMTRTEGEARRVAISRNGHTADPGGQPEAYAVAHRYAPGTESSQTRPHRERRSAGARVVWSLLAGLLLFAMIFAFVTPAAMNLRGDEFAAAMIIGVVLASYSLFALWCVFPRFKKGLWRGVFRKLIFFTGIALSAGCGTAMGLFEPQQEAFLAALGGILFGGIVALFVWFVPVPPYVSLPETKPQNRDENPELRSARRLQIAGIISLTMITVVLPTLLATVPQHNWGEVLPGALLPLVIFGLVATITGFTRRRIILDKLDKSNGMELPIRREFLIDSIDELDSLLERHMALYGYSLKNRGDLFWRFRRGEWTAQFWQSDIRRWKTDLTLAAYKQPQAGYRLSCVLDIDTRYVSLKRKRLKRLQVELDDLRELLGAREMPESN